MKTAQFEINGKIYDVEYTSSHEDNFINDLVSVRLKGQKKIIGKCENNGLFIRQIIENYIKKNYDTNILGTSSTYKTQKSSKL